MQWLQSTYANRFNRLRGEHGHVFQGRYEMSRLTEQPYRVHRNQVSAKRRTPGSVSVTELKANAARVLRAVSRGRSVTVTHRRKEVAQLIPVARIKRFNGQDDSFFRLAELAEPMGVLSNEQIDRLVYGG